METTEAVETLISPPTSGLEAGGEDDERRRPSLRLANLRHARFLLLHLCLTSAARHCRVLCVCALCAVCVCAGKGG